MDAAANASPQAALARALLDPSADVAGAVTAGHTPAAHARFDVHRNTVMSSLARALAEGFPSVERLVGAPYFKAMAAVFVRAHPPTHPVLLAYGERFAAFLERFDPVAHLPYLADVGRLDGLRRRAWHAPDVPALERDAFAGIAAEHAGERRMALHPSVGVLGSRHPARTLWAAQNGDDTLHAIDWQPETVAVWRSGASIHVDVIDVALLALLERARRAPTLAELLAVDDHDGDTALHTRAAAFATALRSGLLVDADARDRARLLVPDAGLFDGFLPPFPSPPTTEIPP
jgi:hypothetical protein